MYAAYPASAVCSIASAAIYAPAATSAAIFALWYSCCSDVGLIETYKVMLMLASDEGSGGFGNVFTAGTNAP